jgi:hypothetical protein
LASQAVVKSQRSAQKADYVVQDLVLVDLVEDFVLRARIDVP